jgi:hypothetical protein
MICSSVVGAPSLTISFWVFGPASPFVTFGERVTCVAPTGFQAPPAMRRKRLTAYCAPAFPAYVCSGTRSIATTPFSNNRAIEDARGRQRFRTLP